MTVQAYLDGTVHVFAPRNTSALATLQVNPPLKRAIEDKLRVFYLRRKGPWKDRAWGSEARFYFVKKGRKI